MRAINTSFQPRKMVPKEICDLTHIGATAQRIQSKEAQLLIEEKYRLRFCHL